MQRVQVLPLISEVGPNACVVHFLYEGDPFRFGKRYQPQFHQALHIGKPFVTDSRLVLFCGEESLYGFGNRNELVNRVDVFDRRFRAAPCDPMLAHLPGVFPRPGTRALRSRYILTLLLLERAFGIDGARAIDHGSSALALNRVLFVDAEVLWVCACAGACVASEQLQVDRWHSTFVLPMMSPGSNTYIIFIKLC